MFTWLAPLTSFFFTYLPLCIYLLTFSFENRPAPFRPEVVKGDETWAKVVSVYFEFLYFCVPDAWLFCVVANLVTCISLDLLYISVVVLLVMAAHSNGQAIMFCSCMVSIFFFLLFFLA